MHEHFDAPLLVFYFRDDHECDDDILPVRTIQQVEAYLLSAVAVLKSYMTTGVRVTATEILALMSQVHGSDPRMYNRNCLRAQSARGQRMYLDASSFLARDAANTFSSPPVG